jgi:formylglycine-generating enzyme required for sulfatase activity
VCLLLLLFVGLLAWGLWTRRPVDPGSSAEAVAHNATKQDKDISSSTTVPPANKDKTGVHNPVEPIRRTDPPASSREEITNSIGMRLRLIPAGRFFMGSTNAEDRPDDETPKHEVEISTPFYLGVYEVTQGQYERVQGKNPSHFSGSGDGSSAVRNLAGTGDLPVESVTWGEAVGFCRRLGAMPGEIAAGREYRLPTEAEWEYACRAGTRTAFHFGAALSSTRANFNGRFPEGGAAEGPYLGRPAPVGSYAPNAFGLFDMHGNVDEWCQDRYGERYYAAGPARDPPGPDQGERRVTRGGSYASLGRCCRSAYRDNALPAARFPGTGFRVAMPVPR